MTLAILCSGQGGQHSAMFKLTGDAPCATALFAHTSALLDGVDPRDLVRSVDAATLHENRAGQLLCSLQALAASAALRAQIPKHITFAGYSVGEVAAWGVARVLAPMATLDLVAKRAEAMDAATVIGDGLLHVRGIPRAIVDQLCGKCGTAIAIVNPGNAFVLGGAKEALAAFAREAKAAAGVNVVTIPVAVASHTPRLVDASIAFLDALSRVPAALPPPSGNRLLSGVDGGFVLNATDGRKKLAAQISTTVQWADCLQGCIESGATAFLELGPGTALKDMIRRAYPGVAARSIDDFGTLEGARAWITQMESSSVH